MDTIPYRQLFWSIGTGEVWTFYILAFFACLVFVVGVLNHLCVWMRGFCDWKIPFSRESVIRVFLDGLFGRRIFRGDIAAGTMHLLILWGFLILFIGTTLSAIDDYIFSFLKGRTYIVYSTCLDIAGLILVAALVWALIRRYLQRVSRLENRIGDLTAPVWLLLVGLSGFVAEGGRLAAQQPEWGGWSFAGQWVSFIWSDPRSALTAYPYLWWVHVLLSLGLIAYIPFSKLFHILAAPAGIYLKDHPVQALPVEDRGQEDEPFSYRDMIYLDACTRCGRCVEVCPSTGAGEAFAPRDFILWAKANASAKYDPIKQIGGVKELCEKIRSGDNRFEAERIWNCTTCLACLEVCPVYVGTPDIIRVARSKVVEEGTRVPSMLSQSLKNVYKYNNPWEATKKKRDKWSGDLVIPDLTKDKEKVDVCYFVGCTTSMDIRAQDIARSFVKILDHTKISFGTLGKKEPCCGDIARRAGEDGLFEMKREDCLDLFKKYDIHEVVTSSPHCFNTFSKEYPGVGDLETSEDQVLFRPRHYTQVLKELLDQGRLSFDKTLPLKLTYHDPCYLGRHNRIFDTPREIIRAVPGVELVEMAHNRENSLCCGGGGDRMWQEDMDADPKMSEIRIREAAAAGAEIVVTACPLCLIMLEDARKTAGLEDDLRVMDMNELLVMALGLDGVAEETERNDQRKIEQGG